MKPRSSAILCSGQAQVRNRALNMLASFNHLGQPIVTACKRSLGQGNVFTPVCHSVQGGFCQSMHHRSHDRGSLSRVFSVQGVLCPGGSLSKESLSRVFSVWGSLSGRSLSMGVSVQGVSVYGGFCPGWYLSKGGSLSGWGSVWGLCPGGSLSREMSLSSGLSVRETPRHGNKWAVRILPECILVFKENGLVLK